MAWGIWLGAVTMTLLAASGRASQNLGDAIAGRAAIAERGGRPTGAALRVQGRGETETRATASLRVPLRLEGRRNVVRAARL
jgi:hypothetical protein